MKHADRDRAFNREQLELLLEKGIHALEKARDISEWNEGSLKRMDSYLSQVPSRVSTSEARSLVQGYVGTMASPCFDDSIRLLRNTITSLLDEIFSNDARCAQDLKEQGERVRVLSSRVDELRGLVGEGGECNDIASFMTKLILLKGSWDQAFDSVLTLMKDQLAFLKGDNSNCCENSVDPVNLSTGNFFYEKEDLKLRGLVPLSFRRIYNALDEHDGSLGHNWVHNYELSVRQESGSTLRLYMEEGKEDIWHLGEDKVWRSRYGTLGTLTAERGTESQSGTETGTETETGTGDQEEGYCFTSQTGISSHFDVEGRLCRQTDLNGNEIFFDYNEQGKLIKASNHQGAFLSYTYETMEEEIIVGSVSTAQSNSAIQVGSAAQSGSNDQSNSTAQGSSDGEAGTPQILKQKNLRLTRVTDHTGRSISFTYQNGTLSTVTGLSGNRTTYTYGPQGRITEVANARGITTVKNEYDRENRTVRQSFPDGGEMEYEYNDKEKKVILTERNGSKTTYVHDDRFRTTQIHYADGTERFAYNEYNRKTLVVDKNGNRTRYAYDSRGNVTQIVNAKREKQNFTYDANNRLLTVTVNGVLKARNVYDRNGNLVKTSDALSRTREIEYNSQGRPVKLIQPDGSALFFACDEKGNVIFVTDARGTVTRYTYDDLNRVTETIDGNGNRTVYEYNEKDDIIRLTNAEGNSRTYEYNESGKLASVTDFDGSRITREYNELNRLVKSTDQCGNTTELFYDRMWNISRLREANGAETVFTYDPLNRLESVTNALGATVRYQYDPNGNRTAILAPDGSETRFTYDSLNRILSVTGPDRAKTGLTYDAEGNVTEQTDAEGNTSYFTYDMAGQRKTVTDAKGNTSSYTYTAMGQLETVTDAAGRTTVYSYEAGGLLSCVTYPDGSFERYTYDKNQNIRTRENREGYHLTYHYDSLNRITRIESSHGQKKDYTYDAVGNVTGMTDALGHTTRYTWSPTGKLTGVEDAEGNRAEYRYDCMGNLTEIRQYGPGQNDSRENSSTGIVPEGQAPSSQLRIDPELLEGQDHNRNSQNLHLTTYTRNLLGQIETITDALGNQEHYAYDATGKLIRKTDKEGYDIAYSYNPAGQIESIRYADGKSVELSYNPLRQLTQIKDWLGITRIEPDALGRAEQVTDHKNREVAYEWGAMGERLATIYPDGREVRYDYDDQLRLSRLSDGETEIQYRYDETGRLSEKAFGNGMLTTYAYNELGKLSRLTHQNRGGILEEYRYEYDLMGNKTRIEKQRAGLEAESGIYDYTYDALGRLNEVIKDGVVQRSYEYDPFGNRVYKRDYTEGSEGRGAEAGAEGTGTAYIYNALNQLLKEDGTTEKVYQYDRRGNLTEIREAGEVINRYEYGPMNRLTSAVGRNGAEAEYFYNGLGLRTGKIESGIPGTGVPGNGVPGSVNTGIETGLNPSRQIDYILDMTKSYHNLLQKKEGRNIQTYLWDGNVAGMNEEDEASYYLQDDLGSPIRLLDAEGENRSLYGYDEFGNDLYRTQGEMQPFGYTGYQRDLIADTYFAQAREYMPESGRFVSEDLVGGFIGNPRTINSYTYCWNSPLQFIDVDGNYPSESDMQQWAWDIYWTNYLDSAKQYINNKIDTAATTAKEVGYDIGEAAFKGGEYIVNAGKAVYYSGKEFIEENIVGVNRILVDKEFENWRYKVQTHTGGSILVFEKKSSNEKITGGSLNLSKELFGITFKGSVSMADSGLKVVASAKLSSKPHYAEVGCGLDKSGYIYKMSIGGGSDSLPIPLPEGIILNSETELMWSLTQTETKASWREIGKALETVVKTAVTVISGIVALVGLAALGGIIILDGVPGDEVLLPEIAAGIGVAWNAIEGSWNAIVGSWNAIVESWTNVMNFCGFA